MQRHIIHKQTVTLEMPGSKDSNLFQDKVSHLLRNDVNQAMEAVFDRLSANGEVIWIDKLRLDLGEITPANFEVEFKTRLIDELTKALPKTTGKTENNGNIRVMRPAESAMAILQYFLSSGRLPWYAGSKKMPEWEAEILEKFEEAEWKALVAWVASESASSPAIIERIVWQFSDKFIVAFLLGVDFGTWSGDPGQIHADLVFFIKNVFEGQVADIRFTGWIAILKAVSSKKSLVQTLQDIVEKRIKDAPVAPVIKILKKTDWNKHFKSPAAKKAIQQMSKDEVFVKRLEKRAEAEIKSKLKKPIPDKTEQSKSKQPEEKKKSAEKRKVADEGEFIFVQNCGIVLLTPFLKPYFADLGLLEDKDFIDEDAQKRAALLLHYLATGITEVAEFDLAFQKLLCSLPMDEPLPNAIELSEKEHSETDELLKTVTQHWTPLNNTSIEGLRTTFLQREGKLQQLDPNWKLLVETKTVDILLDKLPWGYSTIRLPWLRYMVHVEWY